MFAFLQNLKMLLGDPAILELSSGTVSEEILSLVFVVLFCFFCKEDQFEIICSSASTHTHKMSLILHTFLHSTESNQYSASNFYSTPPGQSVYSYSAPATQPSRESSEPTKPVYLAGGRLATHQAGNIIIQTSMLFLCCRNFGLNKSYSNSK